MNSNLVNTSSNPLSRLHPLVAVAAASVVVVSLLGAAAITGILPNSNANAPTALTDTEQANVKQVATSAKPQKLTNHTATTQKTTQVAAATPAPAPSPAKSTEKPNSPIGIGIGAVVGGLLGNQIGSGDGKTLATIAGAVGGGYVGNEIAKKQSD
jgi:uncharacterized protein YcfJ